MHILPKLEFASLLSFFYHPPAVAKRRPPTISIPSAFLHFFIPSPQKTAKKKKHEAATPAHHVRSKKKVQPNYRHLTLVEIEVMHAGYFPPHGSRSIVAKNARELQ